VTDKGQLTTGEVQFWLSEASSCEERQKVELRNRNGYPFLINYFEGISKIDPQQTGEIQYPHVSTGVRYSIINEYFPSTNSLISEIMYQNPDILVEALKPQAEEDAPLMKSALAYAFDKGDALIENRVALFDMLYAGYCAVEVDQLPPEKKNITPSIDEPNAGTEQQPRSIFEKLITKTKELISPEDAEKNLSAMLPPMEANFSTVQGTYFRRYDPLDVPLDWRAERLRERRYNLKKVWMSKAEFDAKYPQFKDRVNAEENKFDYAKHELLAHNRKILLYEFQVRLKGNQYKTIVISPQVKTVEVDCFVRPYIANSFNMKIGTLHKYGKLYPISFSQVNRKMQDELEGYIRHLMDVAERNIPKQIVDRNKVKQDGQDALRSRFVNDLVLVDGNTAGVVTPLQPTMVSSENKELLSIFQDQKNKLWSVSEARLSGRSQVQFATDLSIQEAGFQQRNFDIQEGLRHLIQEEMDTVKDLIVEFWDGEVFLKVTGSDKTKWYEPQTVPNPNNPNESMVINPLTDELTGDYSIKIDIASAGRPNRQQQLAQMVAFMEKLVLFRPILIEQGKDINVDEVKRISKEFGWNPDKIFVAHNPSLNPTVPTVGGETISPEENARRQTEAEARLNGGAGNNLPMPAMRGNIPAQ